MDYMNFNQAFKKLTEGSKIKRNCWTEDHYWFLGRNRDEAFRKIDKLAGCKLL